MEHKTEQAIFANLCMITDGGRVLVQNRHSNFWTGVALPGGHVEPGESFADAVIREVREETGLTIEEPRLCGVKDWCEDGCRYVVLLYRAEKFSGELRASDEGEIWWELLENLEELPLASDMKETIRVLTEDGLSEFFYRLDGDEWIKELK